MNVVIVGDFCDNGRVSNLIKSKNYATIFGNITPIIKNSDFSIVNFEFPVVVDSGNPISKNGPCLKGHINSIEAIKSAGFNVCTLANNHIKDQGANCCINTMHLLEESGFNTVGVGENLKDAGKILYLRSEKEIVAIINCCENEFSIALNNEAGANPLNPIQQYYKIQEAKQTADYIIVIVHGGHENYQLPSPRMKELYRFFIDAGADAVVNHHQHCYSGYEIYKNKPIFYGLGNFIFDWEGKRNSIWNEGFILNLKLDKACVRYELIPYEQCNQTPTIRTLKADMSENFFKNISYLNSIIEDDYKLQSALNNWYNKTGSRHFGIFQPYIDRITSGLFSRGVLPSLLSKKRILLIYNYICCESHLDELRYIVSKNK